MDNQDLSYITQPDWFATGTVSNVPALTQTSGKNVTLTRTGVGVYVFTMGAGGINFENAEFSYAFDVSAIVKLVHTSNTVKTFTLLDNAGVALEAGQVSISCRRVNVKAP